MYEQVIVLCGNSSSMENLFHQIVFYRFISCFYACVSVTERMTDDI